MLMSVKCSAVVSVGVTLTYDDNFTKNEVISVGDFIYVEFNKNGLRQRAEGKVIYINASGTDPKSWYIILDKSEDFESAQVRFCPQNILDLHIIRSGATIKNVKTTNDRYACPYIRIVKNRLQYSIDGIHWKSVVVDPSDIEIKDESGTELGCHEHERPHHHGKPHRPMHQHHHGCNCCDNDELDPDFTIDPDEEFGNEISDDTTGDSNTNDSGVTNPDNTLPDGIIDNNP